MSDKISILDKLTSFRRRGKFSASAWDQRGLIPSDSEMCSRLESLFNDCVENLIDAVNSNLNPQQLKNILKTNKKRQHLTRICFLLFGVFVRIFLLILIN